MLQLQLFYRKKCAIYHLTEVCNILYTSKNDYSEIVIFSRCKILLRANERDSKVLLENEQSKNH